MPPYPAFGKAPDSYGWQIGRAALSECIFFKNCCIASSIRKLRSPSNMITANNRVGVRPDALQPLRHHITLPSSPSRLLVGPQASASIHMAVAWIPRRRRAIPSRDAVQSAMKLQKLVPYGQTWVLILTER
jgi:hypothetical protein